MSFDSSPKVQELQKRLSAFMDEHIYSNEKRHAEEAERHESFNYAILSGEEGSPEQRLLGCVYVDPPEVPHDDGSRCEAEVSWWCVADSPAALADGLGAFVRSWIAEAWPFEHSCTPFNE